LIEYNQFLKDRIDFNIKKGNDANNRKQIFDEKRKEYFEKLKIEQLKHFNNKKDKVKVSLDKIKEKENKRLNDIKSNLQTIEQNNEIKKEQLFEKFNTIQSRPKDFFTRRVQEFMIKRQRSFEKYQQNYSKINSQVEKQNEKILNHYQSKIMKSNHKARSIDFCKQIIR